MPIYEFRCKTCSHVFEELIIRSTDKEEISCPKCGTPRVDQLMSSFACGTSSGGSPSGGGGGGGGCGHGGFS